MYRLNNETEVHTCRLFSIPCAFARLNLHVSCHKSSLEMAALPVCDQSLQFAAVSDQTKKGDSLKTKIAAAVAAEMKRAQSLKIKT